MIPQDIQIIFEEQQDTKINFDKQTDITLGMAEGYCNTDYNPLTNKPQINGVILIGNRTSADIHVQHEMDEITPQQIDNIIYG